MTDIKMRILTLSTYPIDRPRHGGQHRLASICEHYRKAGHQVFTNGVLGAGHYDPSEGFLACPSHETLQRYLANAFLMEDWAIGRWLAEDDAAFAAMAALLPQDVDLIHVELPWLFAFARRWASTRPGGAPRLLYGSENVEHQLKRRIVETYLGAEHAEKCASLVEACEVEAIEGADLIAAVSQHDAEWISKHARAPVILAPNGVGPRHPTLRDLEKANKHTWHRRFALYCASAHPPNIAGFLHMCGKGIGFLAPEERFVVAGSAGPALQDNPRFKQMAGSGSIVVCTGEVEEGTLGALLRMAHALVLPITQGGGTNLKTAEALWTGAHIVSTTVAMRGFEAFIGANGVTVEDDPVRFRVAVRDAMSRPPLQLSPDERDGRRVVLWESTLKVLVERVSQPLMALP